MKIKCITQWNINKMDLQIYTLIKLKSTMTQYFLLMKKIICTELHFLVMKNNVHWALGNDCLFFFFLFGWLVGWGFFCFVFLVFISEWWWIFFFFYLSSKCNKFQINGPWSVNDYSVLLCFWKVEKALVWWWYKLLAGMYMKSDRYLGLDQTVKHNKKKRSYVLLWTGNQ